MEKDLLRSLPSVDEVLNNTEVEPLTKAYGRDAVVNAVRDVLGGLRSELVKEDSTVTLEDISVEKIILRVASHLRQKSTPSLRYAVNASGVILHTGLGRAMLSPKAVDAINDVIRGYCVLAVDLETGERGHRDSHLNGLLCELTGAEAATVVNNNAAATMLILNTLAKGKEVIVSRGQLVEIGGSFRMPEVMETSGAILREVGTTNKTHLRDYVSAINENTGAILRVHQSNYRIIGFFEEPPIEELVEVGRKHALPVIDDLGSGALIDLKPFGLEMEPMVQDSVKAGVDVACFSGDKLIGGPQSGAIVGKAQVIERIRKNPLARAFRVGKMTIAAMEATLRLFLNREKLREEHPTYRMLSLTVNELETRARKVADDLSDLNGTAADIRVVDGQTQVGSGSVPTETVPTKLLSVRAISLSSGNLAKELRYGAPPIFARVHKETVLFDFRIIQQDEDALVGAALRKVLQGGESRS
ncbi:MAG: L-seryl-tRNA(Sec) selenium transferase [bacterium]|nr:L-seryl-tRNA(Sec) selenium transferase [bacterium]